MRLGYHPWNLLSEKIFKFKCLIKEYENGITISTMIRLTYWKGWFNVGKLLYANWRNFLQSIWFSFACNSALHLGKNQHMIIVSSLWLVNILFISVPMCLCSIYHHVGGVVSQGGLACNSIFAIPLLLWLLFVHFTRIFMAPVSFCHCGRENLAS